MSLETLHLDISFGGTLELNGMVNSVLLHCNLGDDFFNHKVFGCHFFLDAAWRRTNAQTVTFERQQLVVLVLETRVQLQKCKRAPWEPWLSENGAKGARGVKASVLVGFRFGGAVVFKMVFIWQQALSSNT